MNKTVAENHDFRKIPLTCLWEGLKLSDAIYNTDGTTVLVPANTPLTARMLEHLAGFLDVEQAVTVSASSYEFIMKKKPVIVNETQEQREDRFGYTTLKKGVEHLLLISQNVTQIEQTTADGITEDVFNKLGEQSSDSIFQCVNVPRPMDEALQRHSLNVAFLNGMMGQWLGMSETEIQQLIQVGLLHDIGKTKIPDEILNAPRKLTSDEFEVIKNHPLYSYDILGTSIEESVRQAVRHHHEKIDGSGYPDCISGDEISLFARITAVSDIYDALLSARVYKKARIPFDVLDEFASGFLSGIDESLLRTFIKHMIKYYKSQKVLMSDGTEGVVTYIPPNDISHPIILCNGQARQVDDDWYCTQIM